MNVNKCTAAGGAFLPALSLFPRVAGGGYSLVCLSCRDSGRAAVS